MTLEDLTELVRVNNRGYRTGSVSRERAHSRGIMHAISYIVPLIPEGKGYIIETRRAKTSETLPGKWLPVVGGHVELQDIGKETGYGIYRNAAVREWHEEMGIYIPKERFVDLGIRKPFDFTEVSGFPNREFISTYAVMYTEDFTLENLNPNKDEVSDLRKRPMSKTIKKLMKRGGNLKFLESDFRIEIANAIQEFYESFTSEAKEKVA